MKGEDEQRHTHTQRQRQRERERERDIEREKKRERDAPALAAMARAGPVPSKMLLLNIQYGFRGLSTLPSSTGFPITLEMSRITSRAARIQTQVVVLTAPLHHQLLHHPFKHNLSLHLHTYIYI